MRKFIHINTLLAMILTLGLAAGCSDDSSIAPVTGPGGGTAAKRILVLEDGGTEVHVIQTLRAQGFDVRSGGIFHEFTGDGLDWADAVVLLTGVDYNHDMDDRGETALVRFVEAGGGLMTTEWMCYSIDRQGFHHILSPLLPVRYADSYAQGTETWTVQVDHPVTEDLPESFATPSGTQFSTVVVRSGATQLVRGSRSAAAVATWTRGGRVVAWSTAGEYGGGEHWNPRLDQLLVNTVSFISQR